ncbi:ATP-binding cassette domain-containing protein, partial [Proteus mirabilis]
MPLISLTGAYLAFSDAPLLDNTDLFIDENERVCLVGRNGAGKSTLLRVLAKKQALADGQVVYEQDLGTERLQKGPPRHNEGTIFDFVAKGVAKDEQNFSLPF